jgi:hypothetical protein
MHDDTDDARGWEAARRLAAGLPDFTHAELHQLALLARELDSRSTDTAA